MGRAKIEIKRIVDDSNRHVTFCRRKMGLFKKARELSILCDAHVGVVVVSNSGRIYECSAPKDMESMLETYNSARGLSTAHKDASSAESSGVISPQVDVQNTSPSCKRHFDDGQSSSIALESNMRNELQKLSKELRLRNGDPEELNLLSLIELHQLEAKIEEGLHNIRKYKVAGYNKHVQESSTDGSSLECLDASECTLDVELRLNTNSTSDCNGRKELVLLTR